MFCCSKKCGYRSSKWFGICQRCGEGEGIEEDIPSSSTNNRMSDVIKKNRVDYSDYKGSELVEYGNSSTYKNKNSPNKVLFNTSFKRLNSIFSSENGILESQVILMAASPGVGKSTLCSQISTNKTIYISTEETESQILNRFNRCEVSQGVNILSTTDVDIVLGEISLFQGDMIILDSLNNIEKGSLSYVRIAQVAQEIIDIVKGRGKSIIIISQVAKNGNIIGMESLSHAVDTVMYMEKSQVSEDIILTSSKNRFGETGEIAIFRHRENGLEESEDFGVISENLIGTTPFMLIAGSKKIPVEIQALICTTDTESRPIRRSIGIDLNKLYMINGIIQNNDKRYSTSRSDIYLSSSNGLKIVGGDISIANSMLSSYYGMYLENIRDYDFSGSLNLNGTISGNKKFKHIKDLIKFYKYKNKGGD